MSSVVFICNLALSNIGKDNIVALTEASAEARACNQFYEHTRDLLLQAYPWRFAGKTAALADLTNDKPGRWAHAYQRPIDCLKVRWVRPQYSEDDPQPKTVKEETATPYDIDGQTIYTDLSPAFLRYTQRLTDPTKYTATFIDALSWQLAVRLAMPLTRDPKVRADAWQVATRMQGSAEALDANEVRETSDHESDLVEARD